MPFTKETSRAAAATQLALLHYARGNEVATSLELAREAVRLDHFLHLYRTAGMVYKATPEKRLIDREYLWLHGRTEGDLGALRLSSTHRRI